MPDIPSAAKRVQHVKTGDTYRVIGIVISEKNYKQGDMASLKMAGMRIQHGKAPLYMQIECSLRDVHVSDMIVVYRSETTQKYWGRLLDDFNTPGRFIALED